MKPKYLIAIIVILIALNILLSYKLYTLSTYIKEDKNRPHSEKQSSNSDLVSVPYFVLKDLEGKRYDVGELIEHIPYTLLVFFSLKDCAACLMEYELWSQIHKMEMINVVAIAQHMDEGELKIWVENAGIKFSVLYDRSSEVKQIFGIHDTPMKILVDNTGRILLSDSVRISSEEKKEFLETVKKSIY